jgi:hypothetical protein
VKIFSYPAVKINAQLFTILFSQINIQINISFSHPPNRPPPGGLGLVKIVSQREPPALSI